VCWRSFENTEEYLESDTYQPGFQLMTWMKVKKEEIYSMSVIALCESVLTVALCESVLTVALCESVLTVALCESVLTVRLFGWVRESSKTVALQSQGKLVLL
jgi:hypothetical protein